MDIGFSLFVVFAFVAVVLLLEGGYVYWSDTKSPEVKRLERRLRGISAGAHGGSEVNLLKNRVLSDIPAVEQFLLQFPRAALVDRFLQQAGSDWTVARFLALSLAGTVSGAVIGSVLDLFPLLTLGLIVGGGVWPFMSLTRKRMQRLFAIEQQLPETLDLISRSLRAGHAFPSALSMVANEGTEPIASEFRVVFEEINFGVSTQNALLNLVTRVPSTDLRYFVMAVILQRETGGNLAELLDQLATLIRERFKLIGRIRVLSAEGKLSAWILTLLPFVVAVIVNLLNPGYMSLLWTDPAGIRVALGALGLMAFGIFWMWRIIKIRI
jgi:tight adherence protein B